MDKYKSTNIIWKLAAGSALLISLVLAAVSFGAHTPTEIASISEIGPLYYLYEIVALGITLMMAGTLWGAGVVVVFYLQQRDQMGALFGAFFFLYTIWLVAGLSSTPEYTPPAAAMWASLILHVVTWLLLPATVHLYYLIPDRLPGYFSRVILIVAYMIGAGGLVLDVLGVLPGRAFLMAVLVQVVLGGMLLGLKAMRWRNTLRWWPLKVIAIGTALTFTPGLLWIVVSAVSTTTVFLSTVATISLAMWPISYPYATYRHLLPSHVERRLRQYMATFIFLLLLSYGVVAFISMSAAWAQWSDSQITAEMVLMFGGGLVTVISYNRFCGWMNRHMYGRIEASAQELTTMLSSRMAEATEADWAGVFEESGRILAVSEMAFYVLNGETYQCVYATIDVPTIMPELRPLSKGCYLPPEEPLAVGWEWVRAMLPLSVRRGVVGVWMIGAHTHDNFYPDECIVELEKAAYILASVIEIQRWQERFVQQEKQAAIGRLVASVAHQFNNPLMMLLGALDNIQRDYPQLADDQWLLMAMRKVDIMADIVKSLSRYFSPTTKEKREIDVNDEVCQAVTLAAQKLKAANVSIDLQLMDVPPVSMFPSELTQVVAVLVDNACNATQAGGGRIIIKTMAAEVVEIMVADEGVGIDPGIRPLIFEPWFTTTNGMGLGLAISYGIIERNMGRILVQSEPNKGSAFLVQLPKAV